MIVFFVFTMSVCILNAVVLLAQLFGNNITLPRYKIISPSYWLVFYSSLLFQVWFWSDKLHIIN